jgi:DNA-binding NtrC family response regulator
MILALVDDLLFRSKIREVARRAGARIIFVRTAADVADAARARPSLAVVDLHAEKLDPLGSLAALRAEGIPAIGFFAHVQTDLARAALEAGATEVMPRSAFAARLPEILAARHTEATEHTESDQHGDTENTE